MSAAFTSGPWRAIRNEVHVGKRRICASVGAGESLGMGQAYERECANARLIAAAPDLLAALRDCLDELEYLSKASDSDYARPGDSTIAQTRAAIAKALGEPQ